MAAPSYKSRAFWPDRFRTPSVTDLVSALNRQNTAVLSHARERLMGDKGLSEHVGWQGVWCWTLIYRAPTDNGLASVYVVPDPAKLRIAVLVPDVRIADLPMKRLSKFIRDGLLHAPVVDGVRWAQWEVQNKSQVDEVLTLAAVGLAQTA